MVTIKGVHEAYSGISIKKKIDSVLNHQRYISILPVCIDSYCVHCPAVVPDILQY